EIDFKINKNAVEVITTVRTKSFTGVEMEALTGTAVTLLTLYDMLKPVDKSMVISEIMLLSKSGGKSGKWLRK
ncbi:cyclic pyranopterin monophosphate synthase MoaC, partial [bacterium]|nr:cyclic pyranopterin monophosphate synthase MoaC [bacterium]